VWVLLADFFAPRQCDVMYPQGKAKGYLDTARAKLLASGVVQ
jgi:hypothetical protein